MNKLTNPNVKTDWTDEDLERLADQLNVYFFHIQRLEGIEDVPTKRIFNGAFLKDSEYCSVCATVSLDCGKCLLKNDSAELIPCCYDKTYIQRFSRAKMSIPQAKKRLKRLLAYYEANGLEVYDE